MTKDLTELKKQYERLGQEIERLENKKPWFPEAGEEFCVIDDVGIVATRSQGKLPVYGNAANYKEYFRTYEQAERVAEARESIRELAFKPHEIDWNDETQEKWFLSYSHSKDEFYASYIFTIQHLGKVYFPTREATEKAEPHFRVLMDEGVGM